MRSRHQGVHAPDRRSPLVLRRHVLCEAASDGFLIISVGRVEIPHQKVLDGHAVQDTLRGAFVMGLTCLRNGRRKMIAPSIPQGRRSAQLNT